jgi:hypothetical protein
MPYFSREEMRDIKNKRIRIFGMPVPEAGRYHFVSLIAGSYLSHDRKGLGLAEGSNIILLFISI